MNESLVSRRDFLAAASAASALVATRRAPLLTFAGSPSEKVRVAVVGLNGRGEVHMQNFAVAPNSEVAAVCDVDSRALAKGVDMVSKAQSRRPAAIADFRRALDDKDIDAIVIATPDHWHAPMAILALAAGKHVYAHPVS
jgi:predicted dehydrogenase